MEIFPGQVFCSFPSVQAGGMTDGFCPTIDGVRKGRQLIMFGPRL